MGTTIWVDERAKQTAWLVKSQLERKLGRDLSWKEAIRYQAILTRQCIKDHNPEVPKEWIQDD